MRTPRPTLTAILLGLTMLATAPLFANAELASESRPTQTKTVIVTEPRWETETVYWSEHFTERPYVTKEVTTYSTYEPAYKYGYTIYSDYNGIPFDQIEEAKLREAWEDAYNNDLITWEQAYPAIRDSYTRIYEYHQNTPPPAIAPSAGGSPTVVHEKTTIIQKK